MAARSTRPRVRGLRPLVIKRLAPGKPEGAALGVPADRPPLARVDDLAAQRLDAGERVPGRLRETRRARVRACRRSWRPGEIRLAADHESRRDGRSRCRTLGSNDGTDGGSRSARGTGEPARRRAASSKSHSHGARRRPALRAPGRLHGVGGRRMRSRACVRGPRRPHRRLRAGYGRHIEFKHGLGDFARDFDAGRYPELFACR